MTGTVPELNTIALTLEGGVAVVRLARPDASNAMNEALWRELRTAFDWVDATPAARVAMLAGAGRNFCAGIDFAMLAGIDRRIAHRDGARSREALRRIILDLQDCLSAVERCRKPVLAAVHGACIGGGLDLIACCDMRYAAADAVFSVREIDIGMVADVGTLQRLPRLIGEGMARELAYTGRDVGAEEALALRLVNRVFATPEALEEGVLAIAVGIAGKSPLAVRGLKEVMNYSRDHSVADGLNHVATWNAAMLLSADLEEAMRARQERRQPRFDD